MLAMTAQGNCSMQNNFNIKPMSASDWSRYRDVRLRALHDSPDAFGSTYERSSRLTDADWIARLQAAQSDQTLPMAAIKDGEFMGLAWVIIEPPDKTVAHLYQMWVDPQCRGCGIGRALIETAIEWAQAIGSLSMQLEVTCGDRPARRLYDAMGFTPTGEPQPVRPGPTRLEQTMVLRFSHDAN